MLCLAHKTNTQAATINNKQQLYTQISNGFLQRKKSITLNIKHVKREAKRVKAKIKGSDHDFYLILYQICKAADTDTSSDDGDYLYGVISNVNARISHNKLYLYGIEYFETLSQTKKVNDKIKRIYDDLALASQNNYQKIRSIYRYVINHVSYEQRADTSAKISTYYSAYGGLFKKKTVCNGYALIIYKLLTYCNIKSQFISGSVTEAGNSYLHAWNSVKYGGSWRYLDACWDDADLYGDQHIYYDYFLLSSKKISKDHKKDTFIR